MLLDAIDLEIKQFCKIIYCKESQEPMKSSEGSKVASEYDELELVNETYANITNCLLAWQCKESKSLHRD